MPLPAQPPTAEQPAGDATQQPPAPAAAQGVDFATAPDGFEADLATSDAIMSQINLISVRMQAEPQLAPQLAVEMRHLTSALRDAQTRVAAGSRSPSHQGANSSHGRSSRGSMQPSPTHRDLDSDCESLAGGHNLSTVDVHKLKLAAFKRGTVGEAQNSVFKLRGQLRAIGLLNHAYLNDGGSLESEKLRGIVMRWIEDDDEVVTDLRTRFGDTGSGFDLYQHVLTAFVAPLTDETTDAETELRRFDWHSVFSKDGRHLQTALNKLWSIIALLDNSRRGDSKFWIKELEDHSPAALTAEVERLLRKRSTAEQAQATTDTLFYSRVMATALNTLRRREKDPSLVTSLQQPGVNVTGTHEQPLPTVTPKIDEIKPTGGGDKPKCSKCNSFGCPKGAKPHLLCDSCDDIPVSRQLEISGNYRRRVQRQREKAGKPPLKSKTPDAPAPAFPLTPPRPPWAR